MNYNSGYTGYTNPGTSYYSSSRTYGYTAGTANYYNNGYSAYPTSPYATSPYNTSPYGYSQRGYGAYAPGSTVIQTPIG
ncbi:MAG TPA: hypothetical protein VF590_22370, partial [Isosphaeraceae bacterium]